MMPIIRKLIISQDDDDGVAFATGRLLILNPGVTLSNAGTALDTVNERTDVELDIKGKIVANDGQIADSALGILSEGDNATIHVFATGRIDSEFTGLNIQGDNLHLILDAGGKITSDARAILYSGTGGRLDIDGKVILNGGGTTSEGINILPSADGVIVDITGLIRADRAIVTSSDDVKIFNTGTIDAVEDGFVFLGSSGQFINGKDGVVTAPQSFGSSGLQVVKNRGEFNGDIFLGGDNDLFDGRGGTLNGRVFGDEGDDTYFVSNRNEDIRENFNEGDHDAVVSTVSFVLGDNFEQLGLFGKKNINATGNDEANDLFGNDGNNRMNGAGGNDVLFGGKGADVFVFGNGGDADAVADFQNNKDRIDLSSVSGIGDFNDIEAFISQSGDDTIIDLDTFSSGLLIILSDILVGKIDATDFQF